jgi:hypothetical protein
VRLRALSLAGEKRGVRGSASDNAPLAQAGPPRAGRC